MLVAQFSYATVPEPGPYSDAKGWKVKQVLPAGADVRAWVESASSSLGAFLPAPLPLLASVGEVDALPRRMRLETYADRQVELLHQVSAGQSHDYRDSSFTHGLLVDCAEGEGLRGVRPAELWDSPGWLRPAGSDQVAAATLVTPLNLGHAPRVPTVEQLWSGHRELALMLLAVVENAFTPTRSGARRGPTRIALIDPTGAVTAGWVAFLSRHLTRGAAWRQLTFSTHERSVEGGGAALSALRIIGIPPEEAEGARRTLGADWLVVDPAVRPELPTDPGKGWELPGGRELVIGPWTQLAERLTVLDELGMGSLSQLIDQLAGWCAGSSDDRPLWAIPAAMLAADPEVLELMVQVAPDAAELTQRHWPAALQLPADRQDVLVGAMNRFSVSPEAAYGRILRAADRNQSVPPGGADLALEGYLKALWGHDSQGRPPAWVHSVGPLPWLPSTARPGRTLGDSLLQEISPLVRWVWLPSPEIPARAPAGIAATSSAAADGGIGGADGSSIGGGGIGSAGGTELEAAETIRLTQPDPVAIVRLLASVVDGFTRWELADRPPVSTEIASQLLESMVVTLRAQTPTVLGTWPALPGYLVERICGELTAMITRDPSITLGPEPARWLDQQCGRLDVRTPLQQWTMLDLDRSLYLTAEQLAEPGAQNLRAAGILRRAGHQAPGRWWAAEEWLAGLRQIFGPSGTDPTAVRWFLEIVVDRRVSAPVLPIGEAVLAGLPLGRAGHELGRWLARPATTGSASMAAFGPPDLARFPAVSLHAWCRPNLPISGELSGDGEFLREIKTVAAMVRRTTPPLHDAVLLRLAIDVLVVDSVFVSGGLLPGRIAESQRSLAEVWEPALRQLGEATIGQPHRRLALARSLFIRSLINELARETGAAGRGYYDPAGSWLTARADPSKDDWRVEWWVKELIDGADRALKQQWIIDVRTEASAAARALAAANGRERPGQRMREAAGAGFGVRLLEMVDGNAPSLALGVIGSKLPFNRGRARRSDEPGGFAAVPGSGPMAAPGAGAVAVPGAGPMAAPGSGPMAAPGAGAVAVPGAGAVAVPGAGPMAAPGSGPMAVPGSGAVPGPPGPTVRPVGPGPGATAPTDGRSTGWSPPG